MNALQEGRGHVTVVGDDAQSIYRFRGSTPGVFAAFQHEYGGGRGGGGGEAVCGGEAGVQGQAPAPAPTLVRRLEKNYRWGWCCCFC